MALFRQVSRMVDDKLVKERVKLTANEEADVRVEWAENEAQQATEETERKREKLVEHEKQKAIDAIISTKKTAIEKMDDAALDAAIANL